MTEYGTQDDGSFRRKHVDTIRSDMGRNFKDEVGDDVELRQNSPQQAFIDTVAPELAQLWEATEAAYYASFFEDSFGEQLDKQLALAGFSRIPSRSATGEVVFSRDDPAPDDISIPAGTVVTTSRTETQPAIPYETTDGVTLNEGQTEVTAPIEALKPWQTEIDEEWLGEETNVGADSITRFDDPVAGVDDVTNPNPTGDEGLGYVSGRDRETDAEFKLRYQNSLAASGAATLRAIRSSVFNAAEGIRSVGVDEVHAAGDYGVTVTVLAPDVPDDDVAQALLDSRAGGLESFGSESGTATLGDGIERTEHFERATRVEIYVEADLTTSDTFPTDGEDRITDGIVRYIGGEATDGITYPGLEIGDDVIIDQVFRRVMEVQGVIEVDLQIGTDPNALAGSNIDVAATEAAMTGVTEVTINVL
ncbi:Baseplate J-like protein [Halopenitus malekzadehii]|uniref:Baseplate J-like protein n=1 Tax=Halopenitus malekzadehii TaxID=1267564 RepID=A0A1H6JGJ6_9EURY|nr:baseplate J/gp47 family protein [Halopenitus malekzadehii]SEH61057.1 Baseplate J-like protein [Halopenitus malekzadehii]